MSALRQEEFLPTGLTIGEFLEWSATVDGKYELVDGDVAAMSPASQTHGLFFAEISYMISDHIRQAGGRCRVVRNPGSRPASAQTTTTASLNSV
jgi:Uma2 family endonuclease